MLDNYWKWKFAGKSYYYIYYILDGGFYSIFLLDFVCFSPRYCTVSMSTEFIIEAISVISGTIRWKSSKSAPTTDGKVIQPTAAPTTNFDARAPETFTRVWANENAVGNVFAKK